MNKKNIIIGAIVLVVASSAILIGQSEMFQGRIFRFRMPRNCAIVAYDCSKVYLYKEDIVSVVTSPVASVVASKVTSSVTSKGGTSQVASKVTSAYASPVASAVPVPREKQKDIDKSKLKELTERVLKLIAEKEYKENPGRFSLSEEEKNSLIELYSRPRARR